jgi:hypothetical protein
LSKTNLLCPSQDIQKEYSLRNPWAGSGFPTYPYGYAIGSQMALDNPLGGIRPIAPINPDKMLLVADGNWSWFINDSTGTNDKDPVRPNWWSNKVAWRHPRPAPYSATNGAANFLTAGGSVVCLKKYVNRNEYKFADWPNEYDQGTAASLADGGAKR